MTTNTIRQMPLYRTVKEIQTFTDDRAVYLEMGFTWEQATLRAFDHMYAKRKADRGGYHV